jgi:hypothetical protein
MEGVTSVAAFVLLHQDGGETNEAAEIFARLDPEERLALRAWRVAPGERIEWLRRNGGHGWTEARLEHVEARASLRLRRELQRRGLWRA